MVSVNLRRACLWTALCVAAAAVAGARADAPKRPNFIVLVADDMRYDALGCEHNPLAHTPNLDRLAAEGVRFANSFVTTSICAISRASLFSGQFESRHGIRDFSKCFSPSAFAQTYPALLKKAGYRVGFIGKWGVGDEPPAKEFDFWKGFPGQGRYFDQPGGRHLTDRMGDQAVEFLACCSKESPFALQISFKAPHEQDGDRTRPFPPAPRFETLLSEVRPARPKSSQPEFFADLPKILQESEGRVRWKNCFGTDELFQQSVKDYYRLVAGIDDVVGRIRRQLKDRSLDADTILVFTSDNGFCLADHGLQGKWFMYEESIRVPLLVFDPRSAKARGLVVQAPALNIDVAPTVLSLAGIAPSERMQGRPLNAWLAGEQSTRPRSDWFYEHHFVHPRIPQSEGVRSERFKYVRYIETNPLVEQLFDLKKDPGELRNLAASPDQASTLATLRARWAELREQAR